MSYVWKQWFSLPLDSVMSDFLCFHDLHLVHDMCHWFGIEVRVCFIDNQALTKDKLETVDELLLGRTDYCKHM